MHSTSRSSHGYWGGGQGAELCGELIDSGPQDDPSDSHSGFASTVTDCPSLAGPTTPTLFNGHTIPGPGRRGLSARHQALQATFLAASYPRRNSSIRTAGVALDQMSRLDWIDRAFGRP